MGNFGLTLDVNNALIVGAGGGLPSEAEAEYMLNANIGLMGRGEEYAVGGEIGTSYMYAPEYESGNHILGWNGGIRGDFLMHSERSSDGALRLNRFWGFRFSLGYKGERYTDESIEHGIYTAIMFQVAWQDRCVPILQGGGYYDVRCAGRDENEVCGMEHTHDPRQCGLGRDECDTYARHTVENGTAFELGIGPYAAYFPGSGRGEFGIAISVGADPFII